MSIQHQLEAILGFNPSEPTQRLWPALIGPTGSGKTTHAREYAAKHDYNYICVLPGTGLPEDILGLPVVRDEKGVVTRYTQRTMPDWARAAVTTRSIIHIDEIDKARPDSIACLLTLLASREVHGVALHPETIILVSGQPVPSWWLDDESGRALTARLSWIRIGYDHGFIERRHRRNVSWLPTVEECEAPTLPVPSVRQVDWLYGFAKKHEADLELVAAVASGVLPRALVSEFMKSISEVYEGQERDDVYDGYFMLEPNELGKYLTSISPAECLTLVERGLTGKQPRYLWSALLNITMSGDADLLQEAFKRLHGAMAQAADDGIDIWNDVDVEDEFERAGLWSHQRPANVKKALDSYNQGNRPE